MKNKKNRIAVAIGGLLLTTSLSMSAHADWTIKDLGKPAIFINDSGQIAGTFMNHAYITGPNGIGMTDLGTLGGLSSYANGINNSGHVVGGGSDAKVFITEANGVGMREIPRPSDGIWMVGNAINDSAQVTGWVYTAVYYSSACPDCEPVEHIESYAYITGPNGVGITKLDSLGGSKSIAFDLNNAGQAVGYSYLSGDTTHHAFISEPNGVGVTDLGTLGGSTSMAFGINDSGQVVGWADIASGNVHHAFITGINGAGMIDLGTLGGDFSEARAINDIGQVVGTSNTADGPGHAFLTGPNGTGMIDLSILEPVVAAGWTQLSPQSINNKGQIVGIGSLHGINHAFSLTPSEISPIPEPTTYAMLLAGLGLFGYMGRRQAKQ